MESTTLPRAARQLSSVEKLYLLRLRPDDLFTLVCFGFLAQLSENVLSVIVYVDGDIRMRLRPLRMLNSRATQETKNIIKRLSGTRTINVENSKILMFRKLVRNQTHLKRSLIFKLIKFRYSYSYIGFGGAAYSPRTSCFNSSIDMFETL